MLRTICLLLVLSRVLAGQDAAPKLEMPKPSPPSIPKPSTTYKPPPMSKLDHALLYSQIALAGAGTGATTAENINKYRNSSPQTVVTSLGLVGAAIVLERVFHDDMSNRTKKWIMVGNFTASTALSVLIGKDVSAVRKRQRAAETVLIIPNVPPVITVVTH